MTILVRHPSAPRDVDGVPPAAVDVNGDRVAVDDDGTFEVPESERTWVDRFADRHDVETESLLVGEQDADGEAESTEEDASKWGEPPFDPSELTVDELESKVEDVADDLSDTEAVALVKAEKNGKNRTTAIEAIEEEVTTALEDVLAKED